MENTTLKTFTMTVPMDIEIDFKAVLVNLQNDIGERIQDEVELDPLDYEKEMDNMCDLITREFIYWAAKNIPTP